MSSRPPLIYSSSRQQRWADQYRTRRYLQDTLKAQLNKRLAIIAHNCSDLDKDSGITSWLRRWTHVIEEYRIRGDDYVDSLNRCDDVINKSYSRNNRRIRDLNTLRRKGIDPSRETWFKFGKEQHLKSSLERGLVRIGSAKKYDSPTFNAAVRDDERLVIQEVPPTEVLMTVLRKDNSRESIPIHGNLTHTIRSTTDF